MNKTPVDIQRVYVSCCKREDSLFPIKPNKSAVKALKQIYSSVIHELYLIIVFRTVMVIIPSDNILVIVLRTGAVLLCHIRNKS